MTELLTLSLRAQPPFEGNISFFRGFPRAQAKNDSPGIVTHPSPGSFLDTQKYIVKYNQALKASEEEISLEYSLVILYLWMEVTDAVLKEGLKVRNNILFQCDNIVHALNSYRDKFPQLLAITVVLHCNAVVAATTAAAAITENVLRNIPHP